MKDKTGTTEKDNMEQMQAQCHINLLNDPGTNITTMFP